ncbi:S-layer homology domain-containing protein [Peribacillus saganii]|uniref:S-layer homology domain-containing protein n=1 Tax=Peribacillus saganii TaxID=2303992 RepID=A0A372LPU1_9BACI|nr:S-layer homology domain-containing protein [Peribacillus saganii]RFU69341.1 S-layer homology domain-containing protein [Peribacillus saganii]
MTRPFSSLSKKLYLLFIALLLTLLCKVSSAGATPPDLNGGVNNEYTYEEQVFLRGKPERFSGKVTKTESEQKDKKTTTYRFTLTGPGEKDKLTRSVSYVTDVKERLDKGQTTTQTTVKTYSEKINFDKETFTLVDYQLSHGIVSDNRPASDYYSGNLVGRKIYKTDNDTITVHFSGRNVGYENFWGATETQIIDYEMVSDRGTALITSTVSDSKTKTMKYEPHDPSLSSFTGGHAVISQRNMIGEYTYDIPYGSGTGKANVGQEMVPKIERLIVPKFRDLAKHWAKDDIEKLYSLGVFDEKSNFFSPNTPMNRYQFTVGVLKGADVRVLEPPKNTRAPRKPVYSDLDVKDPDYLYIESAVQKGITKGVTATKFMPKGYLTRAQAVTILIRALGLEHRAPTPGYKTSYTDNSRIPNWAKDSVYVGTEIGLIYGDTKGRFNPNQTMSRAEASLLIIRYLNFLEKDLQQNYRDDMLFFE